MTRGEKLKQLREEKSMTQSEVAKKIGVATQTIFKYEKDMISNIPPKVIQKLSKYFNVSPAYLMGWIDEETEKKNDIISDIILRLRIDETFKNTVNTLMLSDERSKLLQKITILLNEQTIEQLEIIYTFLKSTLEKDNNEET